MQVSLRALCSDRRVVPAAALCGAGCDRVLQRPTGAPPRDVTDLRRTLLSDFRGIQKRRRAFLVKAAQHQVCLSKSTLGASGERSAVQQRSTAHAIRGTYESGGDATGRGQYGLHGMNRPMLGHGAVLAGSLGLEPHPRDDRRTRHYVRPHHPIMRCAYLIRAQMRNGGTWINLRFIASRSAGQSRPSLQFDCRRPPLLRLVCAST